MHDRQVQKLKVPLELNDNLESIVLCSSTKGLVRLIDVFEVKGMCGEGARLELSSLDEFE